MIVQSSENALSQAVAFFPRADLELQLEDSRQLGMMSLKLEDIETDTPLNFDLFIHMPINNKFLLYTGKGSKMANIQKSRLKTRGVFHLHIKKEEVEEVKKHRAESYLNKTLLAP